MSRKYTTMKDISDKTGLAITTVSKALRNHPDISVKTKREFRMLQRKWAT